MFAYIEHLVAAVIGRAGQARLKNVVGRFDKLKAELKEASENIAHEINANNVKKMALASRNLVLEKEHKVATSLHDKIHSFLS